MGMHLIRAEGKNKHVTVRDLDDEILKGLYENIATLNEFALNYQLLEFVESNFGFLLDYVETQSKFIPKTETSEVFFPFGGLVAGVNLHLLNFLSSSRTLLDHMEANIKRQFGKDSQQYIFFKKSTGVEYDNFFHYKFMYKLRNYVQHSGLPHLGYKFHVQYSNVANGRIGSSTFQLFFYRDSLLKSYNEWGAVVKQELQGQPEKFNLIDIINGYMDSIRELFCGFAEKYWLESPMHAAKYIYNLIGEREGFYEDKYAILDDSLVDKNKGNFAVDWIPCSLIYKVDCIKTIRKHLDRERRFKK